MASSNNSPQQAEEIPPFVNWGTYFDTFLPFAQQLFAKIGFKLEDDFKVKAIKKHFTGKLFKRNLKFLLRAIEDENHHPIIDALLNSKYILDGKDITVKMVDDLQSFVKTDLYKQNLKEAFLARKRDKTRLKLEARTVKGLKLLNLCRKVVNDKIKRESLGKSKAEVEYLSETLKKRVYPVFDIDRFKDNKIRLECLNIYEKKYNNVGVDGIKVEKIEEKMNESYSLFWKDALDNLRVNFIINGGDHILRLERVVKKIKLETTLEDTITNVVKIESNKKARLK